MRTVNGNFSFLRHVVAALIAMVVLTALPVLLYAVAAIVSDDPGGPMMIVFVPMLSLFFAVSMTLLGYFPYASFCQWLARRKSLSAWLPVLVFALLSLLFFGLWRASDREFLPGMGPLQFTGVFAAFATFGFVVYWSVLLFKRPTSVTIASVEQEVYPGSV